MILEGGARLFGEAHDGHREDLMMFRVPEIPGRYTGWAVDTYEGQRVIVHTVFQWVTDEWFVGYGFSDMRAEGIRNDGLTSLPPPCCVGHMSHKYREFSPHEALRPLIECYWTVEASPARGAVVTDQILPDGCIDVLFDLSPGSDHGPGTEPQVVGTMTHPLTVTTRAPSRLWGVRFRPGGARPFIEAPAHELTDTSIPLDCLWGLEADLVWERVALAAGEDEHVRTLDEVLMPLLVRSAGRLDQAVLAAARTVAASRGRATVDALVEAAGIGRRQLERRYRAVVGIGPKLSCTVARFREVVAMLHKEPPVTLSHMAFRAGYADQPHMSRDFKRLAGTSPGAYRRGKTVAHPP